MPVFEEKPPRVEARQVPSLLGQPIMRTRDKMLVLAKWCNGETELDEKGVYVMTLEGVVLARPTQWIVRDNPDTPYYRIVNDIDMLKRYTKVGD